MSAAAQEKRNREKKQRKEKKASILVFPKAAPDAVAVKRGRRHNGAAAVEAVKPLADAARCFAASVAKKKRWMSTCGTPSRE